MLNENAQFIKEESKSFPLLKNDIYQCQLLDVSMSKNKKYQSEEEEDVLSFEFAILAGKDTEGNDARLRLLAKNFVPTFLYISGKTGKNWLYKIVEALIGRDLTKEEEANGISGKTTNFLVGKQCRLLLEKKASKKDAAKFYANIANILSADADFTPLTDEELKTIKEAKEKKASKENKDEFTGGMSDDEIPEELKPENVPF